MNKILRYLAAYILWLITLLLGLWLIVIGRNSYLAVLGALFLGEKDTFLITRQIGFWDRMMIIGMSIAWLMMMIFGEELFRKGVGKQQIIRIFSRIAGIELILIFLADTGLLIVQGAGGFGWLRLLLLLLEMLAGVGLAWIGFRKAPIR